MFKFIKQYAEKVDHIAVYPMISLLIFFLFFVVLLVYVKKMDKKTVDASMFEIPKEYHKFEKN